jgi:nitrogen fixation protein NifX
MSASCLSRDLALRIGVAARTLPGVALPDLMRVLVESLGLPLTGQKLRTLSVPRLRAGANGVLAAVPRAALRAALGYLHGNTAITLVEEDPPQPEIFVEGDLPGSIRLAAASDHGEALDAGFERCRAFLIYQVSGEEIRLVDRRVVPATEGGARNDAARADLIADCQLLYALKIGNRTTAHLMRAGIHPVRVAPADNAREPLAALQRVLRNHPPPWLARAMGQAHVWPRNVAGPVLAHSREHGSQSPA